MDDLEHFYRKIRVGLNIPKEYFDGEQTGAWSSKESLMLQDVRFSRKIAKLQDALREGIVKLCQIHWAIKHRAYLDPAVFIVQLGTLSSVADRQREDILLRKAQILEILANISITMGWNRWVWGDYLLDEIFPLPAELRSKLQTPDPVTEMEAERAKEQSAAGGAGKPGGAKKQAKPPKKVTADNLRMGLRGFGSPKSVTDALSVSSDLMEEFQVIGEEIVEGKAPLEKMLTFFESINIRPGEIVEQQSAGFTKEELQDLIDASPAKAETGELLEVADPGRNWTKLHELGIPPGAFPDGKGYNDALSADDKDFSPDF